LIAFIDEQKKKEKIGEQIRKMGIGWKGVSHVQDTRRQSSVLRMLIGTES